MAIVIDADSHILPADAFDDEEGLRRFRSRWPRRIIDALGRRIVVFPERTQRLTPLQSTMPSPFTPAREAEDSDIEARVTWLDEASFDMQVLVPQPGTCAYALEPDIGLALARSYNNSIARLLQRYPGRFIGLAVVPMQDPVAAIEELDRAVGELGIHAPVVITNVNGRNLSDPEFWPFYQRVEALGVPLVLHGNRNETPGPVGLERLDHMHLDNALGFLYEGTLAITCLILYGVLDSFPRLKVGVLETGAGHLTYLMDVLQEVYESETYGGVNPYAHIPVKELISRPPEEYMDRFWLCFNVKAERRSIPHVVQRFGADRFMAGSDYPHGMGGGGKGVIGLVRDLEGLSLEQKEQLLGLSACALFGIDPDTRQQVRR